MLDILSEYRSKLQEYVTQKLIRQMLDLIENVDLMLSLIIKIQSLAQELLPQKINLEISACLHEYQSLKSILHNQFILVLSDTIDKYFSFDQNPKKSFQEF